MNVNFIAKVFHMNIYWWQIRCDCVCRVLESLLESGVLERVREVALDMYNFYHRQGLGLSWARNTDPDMELER